MNLATTILIFLVQVVTAAALLSHEYQRWHARATPEGFLRSRTQVEAIAKWGTLNPLSQTKLDFLGTLENPYEINKTNRASSTFLNGLIGETSPELLRRLMVETFEDVAPGRWRIVYAQDLCTSFGFGSLFKEVHEADVEIGNNGWITCYIKYNYQTPHQLRIEGNFGVVSNNLMIKVSNVQVKECQKDLQGDEGLFQELKKVTGASIAQSILEKQWKALFSGLLVVQFNFLDDNLAVFDLEFLGRVSGKQICARKEPDFF